MPRVKISLSLHYTVIHNIIVVFSQDLNAPQYDNDVFLKPYCVHGSVYVQYYTHYVCCKYCNFFNFSLQLKAALRKLKVG